MPRADTNKALIKESSPAAVSQLFHYFSRRALFFIILLNYEKSSSTRTLACILSLCQSGVDRVCVFIIIYSLVRVRLFSSLSCSAPTAPATYKCALLPIKYSFSPWLVIPSSNTCAHSVLTKLPESYFSLCGRGKLTDLARNEED